MTLFRQPEKMKNIIFIILLSCLTACASNTYPQRTTGQKIIRVANIIVYTPLCFMYGICPDINDDDEYEY